MSDLRRLHSTFGKPAHHNRHRAKLSETVVHAQTLLPQADQHPGADGSLFFQPRGHFRRAKMIKVDTQAGVFGHSVSELPGRRFLVSPWLAISVWSVIFIFIALIVAGFILAYQARKEFRMRVEEQRKLFENQASDDQSKLSISSKELKSFTRKSIMVLNSSPQKNNTPYRISVAGHLQPRNVFDRPSRDSILVAQITPQSEGFSNDPYNEFSRQAARESFWDPAFRKSVMSVASVSSLMSKIQKRRSVGFAMMEQLDDQALEEDRPKRQHHTAQGSNLRVKGHQAPGQRFVPNVPSRMSRSIKFSDSFADEPVTPPRRASPPITADGPVEIIGPPAMPELISPTPISADEALAQYAASRSTTPAPAPAAPHRSNSLLRLVRRSLTAQSSPAAASLTSDPLTPKNDGDTAVMQPMNFFNGDCAGSLNDSPMHHTDSRLQPFTLTHSIICEEEDDYFRARKISNAAMLMNSVDIKSQSTDILLPRRLPQAVLNESSMSTPASSSLKLRPKLQISPASTSSLCDEADSALSHSNSTSSATPSHARRNNKIELPASPRDGLSSTGSTTNTFTSFSSLMPHSITSTSISSYEEEKANNESDSYRSESNPSPPLTLRRLPSLSTNPYGRRRRQHNSQTSPREEMRMVKLKNRQENLKRNLSNPNQVHTIDPQQPPATPSTSTRSAPVRRTASAQARIPLGGTMPSGGVRDSSFLH